MKYIIFSILLFIFSSAFGQNIEVLKFDQLEQKWNKSNDTLYVLNYWATWCKPCVEELPDFLKLDKKMKGQKFKMILVSLDFPSHIKSKVIPFIKKNNVIPEVIILDDDANVWINKVNEKWDGAIPATQFIKNNKKEFYSEQIDYKKLTQIVTKFN